MKTLISSIILLGFIFYHSTINTPILYAKKAAKIGFIKVARGDVKLERKGKQKKVKKNMKLLEGDKVTTAKKSLLTMYMKDGSIFTIPENSSLVLEKYKFNKKKNKRSASLGLIMGKLRGAVSTVKSKNPNVVVKTPTAVAGIRGTDIFLELGKDRKSKEKEAITRIACLSGKCMGGALPKNKEASWINKLIAELLEKDAWAKVANVDMVQVPEKTAVTAKPGMSPKEMLSNAKKIPASAMQAIKNSAPATDQEQKSAATNNALAIDATNSENMQSDIDNQTGDADLITAFMELDEVKSDLTIKEVNQIIGSTRVTIKVDLSNVF